MPELESFHETVFDAAPVAMFVVDRDMGIIDFNLAAAKLTYPVVTEALRPVTGEVLRCVHANGGCGDSAACRTCVIQKSVRASFDGAHICRRAALMTLRQGGDPVNFEFLVTTAPFQDGQEPLALLALEDLTELESLRERVRGQRGRCCMLGAGGAA
jgi:hypothetical protein